MSAKLMDGILIFSLMLGALSLIYACGKTINGPQIDPKIISETNSFSFQTDELSNVTQVLEFSEKFTGDLVDVVQDCEVTEGDATIIITDARQKELYRSHLHSHGRFMAQKGMPGQWRIVVAIENCSGRLDFQIMQP